MEKTQTSEIKTSPVRLIVRLLLVAIYPAIILGFLLFTAGTLKWIEAYLFCGFYMLYFFTFVVWATFKAPDLIKERTTRKANAKTWDKVLMRVFYTPLLICLLLLCALDYGRLKISAVPFFMKLISGGIEIIAGLLILWVFAVNRFASGIVRIQTDRGHEVITSGPYRIVRHPMYLGIIFFILSIPLFLGSYLGLIPGGLIVILFFVRTYMEDRTLQKELPGYTEYTKQIKKRLIPLIW